MHCRAMDHPPSIRDLPPLDPDSPRGKQLTEELSELFAQLRVNIAARKAAAEIAGEVP